MTEVPKQVRRVCMVSANLFSLASVVYGWAAPLSAMLSLGVDLTEDSQRSNVEELEDAVKNALESSKKSLSSDSQRKILEELEKIEVEPYCLNDLIEKTEAYKSLYCTKMDINVIIGVFDYFLRQEISKRPNLSNLYVLSIGFVTLEKIESMYEILVKVDDKLDNITNEVSAVNKKIAAGQKICIKCLNSIAFILVAMAVFLGMGIFVFQPYEKMMILIAPLCYLISEFLIFFLGKEGYIFVTLRDGIVEKYNLKISEKFWKIIATFIIPIILTVSSFWIIFCSIDMNTDNLLYPTVGLVAGNIVSITLKEARFEQQNFKVN